MTWNEEWTEHRENHIPSLADCALCVLNAYDEQQQHSRKLMTLVAPPACCATCDKGVREDYDPPYGRDSPGLRCVYTSLHLDMDESYRLVCDRWQPGNYTHPYAELYDHLYQHEVPPAERPKHESIRSG